MVAAVVRSPVRVTVIEALKGIAVNRKSTLIVTIHQPSAKLFNLFDKCLFLSGILFILLLFYFCTLNLYSEIWCMRVIVSYGYFWYFCQIAIDNAFSCSLNHNNTKHFLYHLLITSLLLQITILKITLDHFFFFLNTISAIFLYSIHHI